MLVRLQDFDSWLDQIYLSLSENVTLGSELIYKLIFLFTFDN